MCRRRWTCSAVCGAPRHGVLGAIRLLRRWTHAWNDSRDTSDLSCGRRTKHWYSLFFKSGRSILSPLINSFGSMVDWLIDWPMDLSIWLFYWYRSYFSIEISILYTQTEELRTGALQTVEFSIAAIAGAISNESSSSVPEKPVCAMYNLLSVLLECNTFNTLLTTNVFIGVLEQAKYFADILVFGNGGQRIVPETVFTSCFQVCFLFFCCLIIHSLSRVTRNG